MNYQEKLARKAAERELSEALRRTRCPSCHKPVLWHMGDAGASPGASASAKCKLSQGEVMERVHGVVREDDSDVIDVTPREGV